MQNIDFGIEKLLLTLSTIISCFETYPLKLATFTDTPIDPKHAGYVPMMNWVEKSMKNFRKLWNIDMWNIDVLKLGMVCQIEGKLFNGEDGIREKFALGYRDEEKRKKYRKTQLSVLPICCFHHMILSHELNYDNAVDRLRAFFLVVNQLQEDGIRIVTDHPPYDLDIENELPKKATPALKNCCDYCQKVKHNLKRCSRCHVAMYCGAECQLAHWKKEHKLQCDTLKMLMDMDMEQLDIKIKQNK